MSVEEIAKLNFRKKEQTTFLIAIDVCGGAGKSTLAAFLQKTFGAHAFVVHTDDFHQISHQKTEEIGGS